MLLHLCDRQRHSEQPVCLDRFDKKSNYFPVGDKSLKVKNTLCQRSQHTACMSHTELPPATAPPNSGLGAQGWREHVVNFYWILFQQGQDCAWCSGLWTVGSSWAFGRNRDNSSAGTPGNVPLHRGPRNIAPGQTWVWETSKLVHNLSCWLLLLEERQRILPLEAPQMEVNRDGVCWHGAPWDTQ